MLQYSKYYNIQINTKFLCISKGTNFKTMFIFGHVQVIFHIKCLYYKRVYQAFLIYRSIYDFKPGQSVQIIWENDLILSIAYLNFLECIGNSTEMKELLHEFFLNIDDIIYNFPKFPGMYRAFHRDHKFPKYRCFY